MVVVVLEGKMHWTVGRIGWRGRRERWRSVVMVVVVVVVMVYFSSTRSTTIILIFFLRMVGRFRVGGC